MCRFKWYRNSMKIDLCRGASVTALATSPHARLVLVISSMLAAMRVLAQVMLLVSLCDQLRLGVHSLSIAVSRHHMTTLRSKRRIERACHSSLFPSLGCARTLACLALYLAHTTTSLSTRLFTLILDEQLHVLPSLVTDQPRHFRAPIKHVRSSRPHGQHAISSIKRDVEATRRHASQLRRAAHSEQHTQSTEEHLVPYQ